MNVRVPPFSAEGYRPFFVFFPAWGALVMASWGLSLSGGGPMGPVDHGAVMIWGVLGSGVLGFLLTAYPRQNQATLPGPRALALALGAQLATQLAWVASWFGAPTRGLATGLGALLWGGMLAWSLPIAWRNLLGPRDGTTLGVPVALAAGCLGWIAVGLGDAARGFGLGGFGFLTLLALALLDRLLPFFSGRVLPGYSGRRRPGFVFVLAPLLLARGLLGPQRWLDLAVLALLLWQWSGWRPDQGLRAPMVAVLHLGIAWIAAAFALSAWLGAAAGTLPLHLALLGGLGTLLFGLATRVTQGHGGEAVEADRWVYGVLGLAQAAALSRAGLPALGLAGALPLSAGLLSAAFTLWALRFAPKALRRAGASP